MVFKSNGPIKVIDSINFGWIRYRRETKKKNNNRIADWQSVLRITVPYLLKSNPTSCLQITIDIVETYF